mgnify:CR=1 FL=1
MPVKTKLSGKVGSRNPIRPVSMQEDNPVVDTALENKGDVLKMKRWKSAFRTFPRSRSWTILRGFLPKGVAKGQSLLNSRAIE